MYCPLPSCVMPRPSSTLILCASSSLPSFYLSGRTIITYIYFFLIWQPDLICLFSASSGSQVKCYLAIISKSTIISFPANFRHLHLQLPASPDSDFYPSFVIYMIVIVLRFIINLVYLLLLHAFENYPK